MSCFSVTSVHHYYYQLVVFKVGHKQSLNKSLNLTSLKSLLKGGLHMYRSAAACDNQKITFNDNNVITAFST